MNVTRKMHFGPAWLLLVFSLKRSNASLRVSVWRKVQRCGAIPLGNSGYLLPNTAENRERFEWLANSIRNGGGESSVVEVGSIDNCSSSQLKRRFSNARTKDYRALLTELRNAPASAKHRATRLARLRQRFQDITSIDFFGNPLREQVQRTLNEANPVVLKIAKLSPRDYRNRLWITRPRPGIDRVTSAWLIRNFIDRKARFAFATGSKKFTGAIPFDMFEGGFGHRGEDCTFETLTKAFRLRDKRVDVIAQIVHDADLFDEKFGRTEGFGIDAALKGWARQGISDRELLDRGMQLTEGLYRSSE